MDGETDRLRSLVLSLFDANAIKVQDVMLKSGLMSPIYIDLRVIVSYPSLLQELGDVLCAKIRKVQQKKGMQFDSVCGVPYTALPIATAVSLQLPVPMVMRRKEAKSYGTKKLIEGCFKEGDIVLVLEDILTSGTSILETINSLTSSKLRVTDAVVVLDRNQNGIQNMREQGIHVHCLLDLEFVVSVLLQEGKIGKEAADKVTVWLRGNPTHLSTFVQEQSMIARGGIRRLPFSERIQKTGNKMASKIFDIMSRKKSNLCLAADFEKTDQVLAVAECVGEHIAILKLHADILSDFSDKFVQDLLCLAHKYEFVVFEDRKFADIGNTVRLQYSQGVHRIAQWADLVTSHVTPGDGVVQGLKAALSGTGDRACVLVAEMSSAGNLLKQDAVQTACSFAETHPDFVIGFICQNRITCNPALIHMTPGVSLEAGSDSLGQRYLTPEQAIENGADVLIVGRAVTAAGDTAAQAEAAKRFKDRAFQSYLKQC